MIDAIVFLRDDHARPLPKLRKEYVFPSLWFLRYFGYPTNLHLPGFIFQRVDEPWAFKWQMWGLIGPTDLGCKFLGKSHRWSGHAAVCLRLHVEMHRNIATLMESYDLMDVVNHLFQRISRTRRTCEPLSNLSQPYLLALLVWGLEIPLAVLALAMRSRQKKRTSHECIGVMHWCNIYIYQTNTL